MSICVLNVFLRRYSFSAVFLGMVLMAVTEPECEDTAEIVPSATVVNMFGEEGNIVKDWLLLGSFPGSEPRHLHTSDYLKELGGEGSAFIKNNTSVKLQAPVSGKHMLRPKSVSAGQEGLVEFDTEVKTGTPRVVYAYSLLKSHNYEGVRFYLGGGEGVKFYLNGELLRNSWHESEVSERLFSDIFTGDLIDGYNTLLLKFTLTQKRNGFILEVCDTSDRMAPFRERISEFSIETLPQGVEDEARFLKFRPRFPVHIPEGFTEIGINLYEVNSIPGPDKRIISLDKQLSPEIRFKIPGTEARCLRVESVMDLGEDRSISAGSYYWRGRIQTDIKKARTRVGIVSKQARDSQDEGSFKELLVQGMSGWCEELIRNSVRIDRSVLPYLLFSVNKECGYINDIRNDGMVLGDKTFYMRNTLPYGKEEGKASSWLEYKYPDIYKRDTTSEMYRYVLSTPENYSPDKKKRHSLILCLHGREKRGYNIEELREYGALGAIDHEGVASSFIAVPQCPEGVMWNSSKIGALIDELKAKAKIDEDRVYLLGEGMGGFAVWDILIHREDIAAASFIGDARVDTELIENFRRVPLYLINKTESEIVPYDEVGKMIRKFKDIRARDFKHSILTSGRGDGIESSMKSHSIYDWLFDQ